MSISVPLKENFIFCALTIKVFSSPFKYDLEQFVYNSNLECQRDYSKVALKQLVTFNSYQKHYRDFDDFFSSTKLLYLRPKNKKLNFNFVILGFLPNLYYQPQHCVKSVRIWSYPGPYFSAFELNTEVYGISLGIQSEHGKIQTRITPNTDTFYSVQTNDFMSYGKYTLRIFVHDKAV